MKKIFLLLLAAFLSMMGMQAQTEAVIVVDAASGEPLAKASVFDRRGNFIGLTSTSGRMPLVEDESYPIVIRYLGYDPKTVKRPGTTRIRMSENAAQLPEVVVRSDIKRALHILGYMREYSTLTTYTDTVVLFREKMVDFMLPEQGVRKFSGWTLPRMLSCRSYYQFRNAEGLDSVSDAFPDHFSWSDWVCIPRRIPLSEKVRATGSATDTIRGKWAMSRLWRRSADRVFLDVDILTDTVNRRFVPQLSSFIKDDIDFRRLDVRYVFDNCNDDAVTADNLSGMSFNIESRGRGRNLERLFRSHGPAYVDTYAELYIVDKEYIPIKEAKQWEKFAMERGNVAMLVPDGLPELPASTRELIARVENIDVADIRLKTEIDPRIGHLVVLKWDILSRLKRMAKGFIGLK